MKSHLYDVIVEDDKLIVLGTLLYSSRGAKALKEHIFLTRVSEVVKNENVNKGFAGRYADWLKDIRLRRDLRNGDSSSTAKSGGYERNAFVYDGELKGNASGALQNVLANIFGERQPEKIKSVPFGMKGTLFCYAPASGLKV